MDKVFIFDTTLRDGEQAPGIALNAKEKLEIAEQLARLEVDIIEAGFPITSIGDFEAVRRIAENVKGPQIAALARAVDVDIDRAWESIKDARDPRIHVFLSTSDIHRKYMLEATEEEIVAQAVAGVKRAKGYTPNVEFSPQDATRTDGRLPVRGRPRDDRSRCDDDQHPRHRRVHAAARVRGAAHLRLREGPGAERRDPVGALPQRPGSRRRELARRGARRCAADRGRRQRSRRARGELLDRRGRDGDQDAPRPHVGRRRCEHARDRAHVAHGVACSPATRSSRTRRSSARTRSRTSRASTSTACSRTGRPTRS